MTQCENVSEETRYLSFVVANTVYIAMMVHETWTYSRLMGLDFYKQYAVEYLQMYSQFLTYFVMYTLLQMLLVRYQYNKRILSKFQTKKLFSKNDIRKTNHNICILKETSDLFNHLFGWPMLLMICFTSLQTLQHLESIFVQRKNTPTTIAYAVTFLLWHFVSFCKNFFYEIFIPI